MTFKSTAYLFSLFLHSPTNFKKSCFSPFLPLAPNLSLEQRNEELQVEVARLKANLAQQRHWYQAVQAKIAESERVRTDAETRNSALQKDMEQFFDNFGELNNEAKKTEYIVKSF